MWPDWHCKMGGKANSKHTGHSNNESSSLRGLTCPPPLLLLLLLPPPPLPLPPPPPLIPTTIPVLVFVAVLVEEFDGDEVKFCPAYL